MAESDLYQLYAYTRRYGCARSVLLYPHMPGVEPRDFDVLDDKGAVSGERVLVRQIRLHRDLQKEAERHALASELDLIVREGLGLEPIPNNRTSSVAVRQGFEPWEEVKAPSTV